MSEIKTEHSQAFPTPENTPKEAPSKASEEKVVETTTSIEKPTEASEKPIEKPKYDDSGITKEDLQRIKKLDRQKKELQEEVRVEREARLALEKKFSERLPDPEPVFKNDQEKFEHLVQEQAKKVVNEYQETERKKVEAQTSAQKLQETRSKQVMAAKEIYPDMDQLLEQAHEINPPQKVMEFLETTDLPFHLVAELTKNSQHMDNLNNMTPQGIERYMSRLEAKMRDRIDEHTTSKSVPVVEDDTESVEAAPKPPTPVKGNASVPRKPDPSKMSTDDYFAWRKADKLAKAMAIEKENERNNKKRTR